MVRPGQLIGNICPIGSTNCDITIVSGNPPESFAHLAIQLRKTDLVGNEVVSVASATLSQLSALLEAPCLYDKFQNDTSTSAQYDLTNFGRLLAEGKLLQTCPPDFDQTP